MLSADPREPPTSNTHHWWMLLDEEGMSTGLTLDHDTQTGEWWITMRAPDRYTWTWEKIGETFPSREQAMVFAEAVFLMHGPVPRPHRI